MSAKTLSDRINRLFDEEDWEGARKSIERALKKEPDDHWFLTRLSTIYYEHKEYRGALRCVEKAAELAPNCPLVLWDHAGALAALEKYKEAIGVYRRLIGGGWQTIENHQHSEGPEWSQALWIDSLFRIAVCFEHLGQTDQAAKFLHLFLEGRPFCRESIYSSEEAASRLTKLRPDTAAAELSEVQKEVEELCPV